MKKGIFTIAFLMLGMASMAQNIATIDVSKNKDGQFTLSTKGSLITGTVLNGLKEGVWIESAQGTEIPKVIIVFSKGKKNGINIEFDRNGTIQKKSEFVNDTLNGSTINYRNGRMASMSTYKMGVLDGMKVTCYENGTRQEESEYKNGKRDGVTTWFSEKGQRIASYSYSNGLFEGPQEIFYPDGVTKSVKMYHNNVLDGEAQEFYESGALKSSTMYNKGKARKTKEYPDVKKPEPKKPEQKK